MEWNGMEWNGMEWNGMEWNGMEWNQLFRKIVDGGAFSAEKEVLFLRKRKFFSAEKNLKIFSLYTMRMCVPTFSSFAQKELNVYR
jgi:hypothetical protein